MKEVAKNFKREESPSTGWGATWRDSREAPEVQRKGKNVDPINPVSQKTQKKVGACKTNF